MLPGIAPVLTAPILTSVSLFATAQSNSSTITMPASLAAGDLAVLFDWANEGIFISPSVPSGWTQAATATDSFPANSTVSYRILNGTESGSTITGLNGEYDNKIIWVFRGNVPIRTVAPSTWNTQATSGNPSTQTVSASGQPTPLLVLASAANANGNTSTFSTASPAFDATLAQGDMTVGYKIYNTSPADHSIDMNDQGAMNALLSGYLRLA